MKEVCGLCFHHCALEDGQTGICRARGNRNGTIVCLNYGHVTSLALDPIEKKPLRQFHPGSWILSVGSFGCNLRCPFCQNHVISMADGQSVGGRSAYVSPEALAGQARELASQTRPAAGGGMQPGNIGVAYTYNEPLIGFEYVRDCARLVHDQQMVNVLVTNGTIEEGPWRELLPQIDAVNIDLKGFTEAWYRKLGGDLETVKRSIAIAAEFCHVEVTTLLIPGENDSDAEIRALAQWLSGIDPDIPLHLSRFFPRYKMNSGLPTPVSTVFHARDVAGEYLHSVYTGNC